MRWVCSDCVICFVYLGLGREEMRVQRREERKIKINADRVRVMRRVSSEMGAQRGEERKIKIIFDWVRVRVSSEMRAQRGEER